MDFDDDVEEKVIKEIQEEEDEENNNNNINNNINRNSNKENSIKENIEMQELKSKDKESNNKINKINIIESEREPIKEENKSNNKNINDNDNENKDNKKEKEKKKNIKNEKSKKIKIDINKIEQEFLIKENIIEGEIIQNDQETMNKLEKEKILLLPRKIINGKLVKHGICDNFGWFGLNGKLWRSEIEYLGIGTEIYFKILKVFVICFLIISIINIPLFYIYYHNNPEKKVLNYNDALFKFTIGNIASSKI
jgi:hypothetical protein